MARFVVLKSGVSQTVFDFEGETARIGSGVGVDLQLESANVQGELFVLNKTPEGYELLKRAEGLSLMINGAPSGDRVLLREGDKIAFLDYLIVVTYPPEKRSVADARISQEKPPALPKPGADATAPLATQPPPPPPPVAEKPEPPPVKRGARETVILNSEMIEKASAQFRGDVAPAVDRSGKRLDTEPVVLPPVKPTVEPAKPTGKPKITPVYSLVGLSGQHKGMTREIDIAEYTVGRNTALCDLVIDHDEQGQMDTSVSREHFVIHSTDEGLYLTDKRSQLRTYLNWKVIEPNQREFIAPEDIISIPTPSGEVIFRLCFRGQENFAPPVRPSNRILRIILILAGAIALLGIVLIWLLSRR